MSHNIQGAWCKEAGRGVMSSLLSSLGVFLLHFVKSEGDTNRETVWLTGSRACAKVIALNQFPTLICVGTEDIANCSLQSI